MEEKSTNNKRKNKIQEKTPKNGYDMRYPYYLGPWKKSIPYVDEGFAEDLYYDEPHAKRKKAIIKKYPQIVNLYGPSKKTKYYIMGHIFLHVIGLIIMTKIENYFLLFLFCYFYGGSITSLSGILIHECTHSLASNSSYLNTFFGYLSNVPLLVPIYGSFQKYHLDHHFYLGVKSKDADLPMDIEVKMVEGCSLAKIIYIFLYPIFYVTRSFKIRKGIVKEEVFNLFFHLATLTVTYHYFGIKAIYYMAVCTWIAYSIHPSAAHLIQEHFTFADGQETYSYYGPLNKFFLNIGYHNEHHDFPQIAWDRLPEIRQMAPEFYNNFYIQTSWLGVIYEFIRRPVYGPQSRVIRTVETQIKGRQLKIVTDCDY